MSCKMCVVRGHDQEALREELIVITKERDMYHRWHIDAAMERDVLDRDKVLAEMDASDARYERDVALARIQRLRDAVTDALTGYGTIDGRIVKVEIPLAIQNHMSNVLDRDDAASKGSKK